MRLRTLFVVTGMSGSGKSNAIKALEDAGFFCVDNLPIDLIPKFLEIIEGAGGELGPKVALGLDLREASLTERFPEIAELLKKSRLDVRILFVDASDDSLLQRFSETRRPHPLAPTGSVREGIKLERARLELIREKADRVLDTTGLNVHQLREAVLGETDVLAGSRKMTVNIVSFGFAFGLPPEASLVFDVRFLPNPHFVPELRPLTGEDPRVSGYVCQSPQGAEFLAALSGFVGYLLPKYLGEGKTYLTIAVGCTGGRHRSVAVAKWLYDTLSGAPEVVLNLAHRDRARHLG
jgi:RNase adapter protein RapZ